MEFLLTLTRFLKQPPLKTRMEYFYTKKGFKIQCIQQILLARLHKEMKIGGSLS